MNIKIDEIIRTKRRTLAIEITSDARLVVRAPSGMAPQRIAELVRQKDGWIEQKLAEVKGRDNRHPPKLCAEGELFPLLGREYPLHYSGGANKAGISGGALTLPEMPKSAAEQAIVSFYREEAAAYFRARANYFAPFIGVFFKSLSVTGALTRWGSCGTGGRLCFTWRLILAPPDEVDYVIVHELCHIKELNHSAAFWDYVEKAMPDYDERRKRLRQNGALLRRDFFEDGDVRTVNNPACFSKVNY